MSLNCCAYFALAATLLLSRSGLAADPPDPASEPLPEGAKQRFGVGRPILRGSPSVGLIPPTFTEFLVPAIDGARLYNLGTGRPREATGRNEAGRVIVSDNGKRAAVARLGAVDVVEVETLKRIFAAKPPEGLFIPNIAGVSLSADGKVLAYGCQNKEGKGWVVVCEVEKNEVIARVETQLPPPVFPTLSPDGAILVSHGPPALPPTIAQPVAKPGPERTAQVWDVAASKELFPIRMTGMGGTIGTAAFSPDARIVAVSAGDGPIDLWDVKSGKRTKTLLGRVGQGVRVAIAPDGKTIASIGADYRIQRWTIDGKPLDITAPPIGVTGAPITGLSFADNSRVIAWMTGYQFAIAWEAPEGKLLSPSTEHIAPIRSISFANGATDLYTSGHDGRLLRWDQTTGRILERISLHPAQPPLSAPVGPIVDLSPDGARALWARQPLENFDLTDGSDLFCIPPPSTPPGVMNIAYANDLTKVVTVSRQAPPEEAWSCVVWDLDKRKRFAEFNVPAPAESALLACALSPRQDRLMFAYNAKNANGQISFVTACMDRKTGKKLAEASDSRAVAGLSMALADETTVVFASRSGRMWSVDYGTGRVGDDIDNIPMRGTNITMPIEFSPDGKRFAVGIIGEHAEVYCVRIYDWAQRKALHTFTGHQGPVTSLRFSLDGKFLASGAQDASVILWDLSKIPDVK